MRHRLSGLSNYGSTAFTGRWSGWGMAQFAYLWRKLAKLSALFILPPIAHCLWKAKRVTDLVQALRPQLIPVSWQSVLRWHIVTKLAAITFQQALGYLPSHRASVHISPCQTAWWQGACVSTSCHELNLWVQRQNHYATNQATVRLQRILPPKMPFFVHQKVQISSKILPQIPNFTSFSPSENQAFSAVYNCYCC